MIRFCPLFSSSSGNSVYIGDNDGGILVDVGRSAKQTEIMLKNIGVDINTIKGIFITHEHSDHICGVKVFAKRYNIPVYASTATILELKRKEILTPYHIDITVNDSPVCIAGMSVQPIKTSHDCADGRGYVITGSDGSTKVSVATDTGYVTNDILEKISGSKLLYIESNHDVEMLRSGPYPYQLQQRILSNIGHLSNDSCAAALKTLINNGTTHIILAHLSQENNTPELAFNTNVNALTEIGALNNRDYILKVAKPENDSGVITV
ncbi:MAG: MBL fold metallo-hydrolase [Acutalibacteraceae bacterium]